LSGSFGKRFGCEKGGKNYKLKNPPWMAFYTPESLETGRSEAELKKKKKEYGVWVKKKKKKYNTK
jgi:hypothetical protein